MAIFCTVWNTIALTALSNYSRAGQLHCPPCSLRQVLPPKPERCRLPVATASFGLRPPCLYKSDVVISLKPLANIDKLDRSRVSYPRPGRHIMAVVEGYLLDRFARWALLQEAAM